MYLTTEPQNNMKQKLTKLKEEIDNTTLIDTATPHFQ